jgi:hypothetical protein
VVSEITLNIANVTVPPENANPIPAGDFIAVTVRSHGRWEPEATWRPNVAPPTQFLSAGLGAAAAEVGAPYAYSRVLSHDEGSVTVFLPRESDDQASAG